MTNRDFLDPPIEIIAQSPRLEMIKSRLKSVGMRPYDAREDLHETDPLLIDTSALNDEYLRKVRRQIVRNVDRPIVLLASSDAPSIQDAITISHESELNAVPMRLQILQRRKNRLSEGQLRIRTAEIIAGEFAYKPDIEDARVLFVGDGSSRFLALTAALKSIGMPVTAALTALTANAYLEEEPFSSVVVNIDDGGDSAYDFLRTFADDYLRSCVPVFALISNRKKRSATEQAALANATEIIDADLPIPETAEHIAELADYHSAVTPIRPAAISDPQIRDVTTGLFTKEFLQQHLHNQIADTRDSIRPLAFMTLQLSSAHDSNSAARDALPTLAQIVSRHLRQTDCAGRLDWSTIAISMRDTSHSGGVAFARRLISDLGGHATQASSTPLPSGIELTWRIIEKRRYHSASELIKIGTSGPKTRIVSAA